MSGGVELSPQGIQALISQNDRLRSEIINLKWDINAYRGALGYSVPGDHTGKLTDGTVPQCGLCNSEYRKNIDEALRVANTAIIDSPCFCVADDSPPCKRCVALAKINKLL